MKRALFVNVTDLKYPRHQALTQALCNSGYHIEVVERPKGVGYMRRCFALLVQAISKGRCDVVVSGEFANSYAWVTWLIARFRRATHVVDGFIGMYETHVEDTGATNAGSVKAWAYRLVDSMAVRLADIYLVDTYARKAAILERQVPSGHQVEVCVLPVGAPSWAQPGPMPSSSDEIRFLYYGNYIPLHGLERVLLAFSSLPQTMAWSARIIGPMTLAGPFRSLAEECGISDRVTFMDSVPAEVLNGYISDCHVVIGIFGSSPKAQSVIANKVWQGIAAGRLVLTQSSPGTREIESIFAKSLILPPRVDPASIASTIATDLPVRITEGVTPGARVMVDDYLRRHYLQFLDLVNTAAS